MTEPEPLVIDGAAWLASCRGVSWFGVPLPSWWHRCKPELQGWIGADYVERCACGASRMRRDGRWVNRNSTRREQRGE